MYNNEDHILLEILATLKSIDNKLTSIERAQKESKYPSLPFIDVPKPPSFNHKK